MEDEIEFALEDGTPEKKISKLADIEVKFKNDLQVINVAKPKVKVPKQVPKVKEDIFSNLIKVYDNVLDEDYCDYLIEKFEKYNNESVKIESDRRSFSQLHIMDSNFGVKATEGWEEDSKKIISIFDEYSKKYIKDCKIDKFQFPEKYTWEGIRIKKYNDNKVDEFFNHVDVDDYHGARRFLTFFCYLDNNRGGATDFPDYGWRGKMREKLVFHSPSKKGSMLIFPPMWPWLHRGNRPKGKPKYIVQTYLHYV